VRGLSLQTLDLDNIFFKKESAHGTYIYRDT